MNDNPASHLRRLAFIAQSLPGRRLASVLTITIWIVFTIVVLSGAKQFTLWSQVVYLYRHGADPAQLLVQMHPHFLRYLLVYPIFESAAAMRVSADGIFSIVCLFGLFAVFLAVRTLDRLLSHSPSNWANLCWSLLLCGLAAAMNGRGVLAFLGYALLLVSLVPVFDDDRPRWWLFASLPAAMLFCSVSSGVLAVAFMFIVVACTITALRHKEVYLPANTALLLVSAAATLVLCWKFLIVGVEKNLVFFGGGIDGLWEMLAHGAGKILTLVNPLTLAPLALVVIAAGFIAIWAGRAFAPAVVICGAAGLIAVAGGVFGFTTLTIVVVPALAMLRLLLARPAHIVRLPPRSSGQLTAGRP